MGRNLRTTRSRSVGEPLLCPNPPDGSYFPRIYFINPDGSVNYDIISDPNADKYQFFYPDDQRIIDSMKQMIKEVKAKRQRKKAKKEKEEDLKDVNESVYQEEDL